MNNIYHPPMGRSMKRYELVIRRLIALVLPFALMIAIVMVTVALIGCNPNPIVVERKPALPETPASVDLPPVAGNTADNGNGTFSLTFPLPNSDGGGGSRSLLNYQSPDALSRVVNYYQLVVVDVATPDSVWASATVDKTINPSNTLTVNVKSDTIYHILFLHGLKVGNAEPLLLGSGYIKYKIGTVSTTVIIRMVPLLADAVITGAGGAPWAGVRNIAWVKDESFDVTVSLRSRIAGQDAAASPHGNPLWPLLLAQERKTELWQNSFRDASLGDSPQYESEQGKGNGAAWTGSYWYYDGEKDWSNNGAAIPAIPSKLNIPPSSAATASVNVYYSEGAAPTTPKATQSGKTDSNAESGKTTGIFKFSGFTSLKGTSDTTDYGKFSFNHDMTYIPFGIADWSTARGGVTVAPQWKIGGGDLYLAYRLYGRAGWLASDAVGGASAPGVPAGVSWVTASRDLQDLADLAGAAYAQDSATKKHIWVEAGIYKNSAGSGTVVDIKEGTALYGGFKKADSDAARLALLNEHPDRSTWFKTYTQLLVGNSYGTVADAARKTTINANGSGTAVKVDGAAHGAANIVFDGFTVTGGAASGLWINNAANTSLFTNLELNGNTNTGPGGGIYVKDGAPHLDKLTVTGNTSTNDWGGGLYIGGVSTALVTNALVSGNKSSDSESGGGIAIAGASPRLENIVVTGNKASTNGGGIYNHGSPVIVNALISGNTCEVIVPNIGAYGTGGALYTTVGTMTLVNALISGNKTEVIVATDANMEQYGGGGVKVGGGGQLNLINCTVSGNYASYNIPVGSTDLLPGGGIMVAYGGGKVRAYNSLVLGNTGASGTDSDVTRNDVATTAGCEFYQYSSLIGLPRLTEAEQESILYNAVYAFCIHQGGTPAVNSANAAVAAYRAGGDAAAITVATIAAFEGYDNDGLYETVVDALAEIASSRNNNEPLAKLRQFFVAFPALPTAGNTGQVGYNSAIWDFHLGAGATEAINSGLSDYLDESHTAVPGGLQQDLDGAARTHNIAPDMGAYESSYLGIGTGGA